MIKVERIPDIKFSTNSSYSREVIKVTRKFDIPQGISHELYELDKEMVKLWEQFSRKHSEISFITWMENRDRVLNMLNIVYRYRSLYESKEFPSENELFAYRFKYPLLIENLKIENIDSESKL